MNLYVDRVTLSPNLCAQTPKPDGTSCDDVNPCTQVDACMGGACEGASPVVCPASDQCRVVGACDPTTGQCPETLTVGAPCDDGNACTFGDTCEFVEPNAAQCGGFAPPCSLPPNGCQSLPGVCDPATGCAECEPTYPDDVRAVCGADGHCEVALGPPA